MILEPISGIYLSTNKKTARNFACVRCVDTLTKKEYVVFAAGKTVDTHESFLLSVDEAKDLFTLDNQVSHYLFLTLFETYNDVQCTKGVMQRALISDSFIDAMKRSKEKQVKKLKL